MVEQRAYGIDIRYSPADLLQHENENFDTPDYCQDLVACAVGKHTDRNYYMRLEVLPCPSFLDEYCSGSYIFNCDYLYQRLVFQSDVTGA